MKKNLMWMFAAILTSGLALTACSVEDNPNPNPVLPNDPEELWDKTQTTFDFEDGNPVFTATSRMSVAVQDNADNGSKVLAFINAGNAQNGYGFAYYDFSDLVQQATKVTVKFDYWNTNGGRGQMTIGDALVRGTNGAGAGFGRNTYGAKGAIFRIGSDKNNFFVNGTTLGSAADWCNKWLTVEVSIYNFDRQVQWVVKQGDEVLAESGTTETPEEGAEPVFTPGKEDFWQADANEATQIDCFGFINNNTSYIDNLSIENAVDPSVKFADYTVRYVNAEGEDIKEPATRNARVGSIATLLESDKASTYNEDKTRKYIFDTDDAAETPIAEEGTVITLKFRDAEKYKTVLNCYIEGSTTRVTPVIRGEQFEGDNLYVKPAVGYGLDGKYYFVEPNQKDSKGNPFNGYVYTFTGTETKQQGYIWGTVYYTLDASVVYYAEAENLTIEGELGIPFSDKTFDRMSQATAILPLVDATLTTEPIKAGTYSVALYGRNDGGAAASNAVLFIKAADGTLREAGTPDTAEWGSATMGWLTFANVTIAEGESLVIKGVAPATTQWDCIKVFTPAPAE